MEIKNYFLENFIKMKDDTCKIADTTTTKKTTTRRPMENNIFNEIATFFINLFNSLISIF
jgi:hypothetical protein